MVLSFAPVPLWDGASLVKVGVTAVEKAEMNLARFTARTGNYPIRKQELEQMKKFGIMPSQGDQLKRSDSPVHVRRQRDSQGWELPVPLNLGRSKFRLPSFSRLCLE
jgi:hypothetical protein